MNANSNGSVTPHTKAQRAADATRPIAAFLFFALVHLNGDCSIDVEYKNYRHDERFDLDMYPMENGAHDYELPAGLTASEAAREIAFNAKMVA